MVKKRIVDIKEVKAALELVQSKYGKVNRSCLQAEGYDWVYKYLNEAAKKYGERVSSWDIAREIAQGIKAQNSLSAEEHLQALVTCKEQYGEVSYKNLIKVSPSTYYYFADLGKEQNLTGMQYISKMFPAIVNKKNVALTREEHLANLMALQEKYGEVSPANLRNEYIQTFNYISGETSRRRKKGEDISFWETAREIYPDILVGNARLTKKAYIKNLKDCYNQYGKIDSKLLREFSPTTYGWLSHQTAVLKRQGKNVSLWDVAKSLFDENEIEVTETRQSRTVEELMEEVKALSQNGTVNLSRDKTLYQCVVRFANRDGMNYAEWLEINSKKVLGETISVAGVVVNTSAIDEITARLTELYGVGGDCAGLSTTDPTTYARVVRLKNYFPGGAKKNMQETFEALGFRYTSGIIRDRNVSYASLSESLKREFPTTTVLPVNVTMKSRSFRIAHLLAGMENIPVNEVLAKVGYSRQIANATSANNGTINYGRRIVAKRGEKTIAKTEDENEE